MAKKKGRKSATGKYSSYDELVQNVHFYYHHTEQHQAQIARTVGVSETTVSSILKRRKPNV